MLELLHAGPHRLDLGDILYAPNTLQTPDGRILMLAWLQELRSGGGFDYAGCLSVPRHLSLRGAGSAIAEVPDTDQARCRIQNRQSCSNSHALPSSWPFRMSTHDCAGDRLHQQPAAELAQLRAQPGTHLASLPIAAGQRAQLPGISGPSLDISFSLRQGQSDRAGLLLRPWLHADSADAQPTAAAFIVDWQSQSLQVPQLCCCVGL